MRNVTQKFSNIHLMPVVVACLFMASNLTGVNPIMEVRADPPDDARTADSFSCPVVEPRVREKLENFIFPDPRYEPKWADEEVDKIIPGLAFIEGRHEIKALQDPTDTTACKHFNEIHARELSETSTFPDQAEPYYVFDVVYYKAAGFYFVVISHVPTPQPDDPFQKVIELTHDRIVVYDKDFNKIDEYMI